MFKFGLPKKATYFSSESITCAQMINEIYEFAMKIARLVGLGIFDENFSMMNWRTGPMIFVLITGSFLSVYDIYKFSDDNFRCIFCLLLCSGQLQSYIKLYSFAYKRHDFIELRQKADKFDENFKSQKSSKILEEKLMQATHVCAILSFLYFSSYILISSFPILFYFITGKRILHVGIELPLIDWEQSFVGYALNFAHQMIALSAFSCLCTMILIVEVILVTCSIHQFDVLEIMLDDLDELLVKNDNGENNSKIEQHLKRVYQTHQNLMSFLIKLESAFVPYYIVEMGALIFQKVLVLYALINLNFFPGYLISVLAGAQIFLPCAISSVLEIKGDKFYEHLYNISWQFLSRIDRKKLVFILCYAKEPKRLSIGFTYLGFDTFLEIYKAIYSYLMMLQSFK